VILGRAIEYPCFACAGAHNECRNFKFLVLLVESQICSSSVEAPRKIYDMKFGMKSLSYSGPQFNENEQKDSIL
jgi:hypothetical protein